MNIDECRIPAEPGEYDIRHYTKESCFMNSGPKKSKFQVEEQPEGRFPANVILTYGESDKDEVIGGFPTSGKGNGKQPYNYAGREYNNKETSMFNGDKPQAPSNYNDIGSAARYFYCAKASAEDRDEGLESFKAKKKVFNGQNNESSEDMKDVEARFTTYAKNYHPTVKPTALMQYLVRLVTPKDGVVLDPFMGSGSTGKAVILEDIEADKYYSFIGIEKEEEYYKIAEARTKGIKNKYKLLLNDKV